MKKVIIILLLAFFLPQINGYCQYIEITDDENGDWTEQNVTLYNTSEADIMVRTGDIDNLGFGWPAEFDPFSGSPTSPHGFPWTVDSTDAPGTDRIMVVSSYNGSPPYGQDGYTSNTSRPENLPRSILLTYDLKNLELESAVLQIFVDDFQASIWGANYFVTINGVSAPYAANVINSLSQTGPVGKIINVTIPEEYLYLLESGSMNILFDDTTTGAGDGYAIDFVKLLLNPTGFTYTAKVYGFVTDAATSDPIENAIVTASGSGEIFTDENGYFYFDSIPAGITQLTATKFSYDTATFLVDLIVNDSIRQDFTLNEILDAEFVADDPIASSIPHTVQFTDQTSLNPTAWLWDFGDGTTSEDQNPEHTYTDAGYYTVSLTASNGMETNTETKEHYIQLTVSGVNEHKIISNFLVAPNPMKNRAYVSFMLSDVCQEVTVEICDLQGKVIESTQQHLLNQGEHSIEINLEDLVDGLYFLNLKTGNTSVSRKIIVSN